MNPRPLQLTRPTIKKRHGRCQCSIDAIEFNQGHVAGAVAPAFSTVIRAATLVWSVSVDTPAFLPLRRTIDQYASAGDRARD